MFEAPESEKPIVTKRERELREALEINRVKEYLLNENGYRPVLIVDAEESISVYYTTNNRDPIIGQKAFDQGIARGDLELILLSRRQHVQVPRKPTTHTLGYRQAST